MATSIHTTAIAAAGAGPGGGGSVEPAALAKTMGRLGDGTAPASVIGAIVDLLAAPLAATLDETMTEAGR